MRLTFRKTRLLKKGNFAYRFSVVLQKLPKYDYGTMGFSRLCDFTTMRRLWKTGKKTGRSEMVAQFYGKKWSKIGRIGGKEVNLGFIGKNRVFLPVYPVDLTNSYIFRRFSGPSRRFKSFRG